MNTENNILIAKFAGFTNEKNLGWYDNDNILPEYVFINEGGNTFDIDKLKFAESFDWLMGVVEKIKNLDYITDIFINVLTGYTTIECYSETEDKHNTVIAGYGEGIEGVYKAVVGFIEWYNENN